MIQDYIENNKYMEALELLEGKDDEHSRYQKLVCLFGLKDFMEASKEVLVAKGLAKETYYDVVAMQVAIYSELQEYDQAIEVLVEELSMPYIPQNYEQMFNHAYDEVLINKQEMRDFTKSKVFTNEDLENVLSRDDVSVDLLYMAIEQLQEANIRMFIPFIRGFLSKDNNLDLAKSLLVEILIDQGVDEDLIIFKNGVNYDLNPSLESHILQQDVAIYLQENLINQVEIDNPSLSQLCNEFATYYLYAIYPKYIDESEFSIIAASIYYHLATIQYIDVDLDDLANEYQVDVEDILEMMKILEKISY